MLKKAAAQYEKAIDWYKNKSLLAAIGFIKDVDERINMLQSDPYRYRNTYNQFYEISLRKYPYMVIYKIDDNAGSVLIASIHHHKQNPKRKYKH